MVKVKHNTKDVGNQMIRTYIRKLKEAKRAGQDLIGSMDLESIDNSMIEFMEEVENMDIHFEIAIKILEELDRR